jgi:pSer/pThr/pTyr-binding forkhead associated (FHA) protein
MARAIPDLDQATRIGAVTPAAPPAASRPAGTAAAPPPAPAVADVPDGATVMLASAALVVEDPAGTKEFPLTVLNGIGRSEENRICVSNPGISRKHAVITAVAGGFMIKDLGSQNGTFVNGQRVTEKRLAEGDTVDVGSMKFVFRTPWPARTGAAAARSGAAAQGKR